MNSLMSPEEQEKLRHLIRGRMGAETARRFFTNMARTVGVFNYASISLRENSAPQALMMELLRLCVVMLHGTFEDFLRTLAGTGLMGASPKVLADLPFPGQLSPAKVDLGFIAGFRGKSVDELIGASVAHYLERLTVNNVRDLVTLLDRMGVDTEAVCPRDQRDAIAWLMERRHRIVHEADMPELANTAPVDFTVEDGRRLSDLFNLIKRIAISVLESVTPGFVDHEHEGLRAALDAYDKATSEPRVWSSHPPGHPSH